MPKRKKPGRPKKKQSLTIKSEETKILAGISICLVGLMGILSQSIDAKVFELIRKICGIGAITAGITILLLGISILGINFKYNKLRSILGLTLLSVILSTAAHIIIPSSQSYEIAVNGLAGGLLGYTISKVLIDTFGRIISYLILLILAVVSFSLISSVSLNQIKTILASIFAKSQRRLEEKRNNSVENAELTSESTENNDLEFIGSVNQLKKTKESNNPAEIHKIDEQLELNKNSEKQEYPVNLPTKDTSEENVNPEKPTYPDWQLPPIDLLNPSQPIKIDTKDHEAKSKIIEETLKSFGIQAKVAEIAVGPRVVQFALRITVGTKVSKIKSLGNDLALALAAPSGTVRIEAPIAGTSLIGIEIPNSTPGMVTLKDLQLSEGIKNFKGELPLLLGKDVAGECVVKDLTKMPHLLVAGATGSGKSVCVNTILCGLLMKYSPDELKFILVDPKMVELPPYNKIPHLLSPVITDVDKVVYSLEWLVTEMQRRYRILNKEGLRNIQQYHKEMEPSSMPYIVFVVDEMADLMLSKGVEVESKIVRLVQMARAVGIHLILATQRPSVDVITGLIKANVPARIGMNVATAIDSRVILDMQGAENLLGNGDMLFKAPDVSRPYRIQGAFVSNEEVERITKFIREQTDEVSYNNEVTKPQNQNSGTGGSDGGSFSDDNLFDEALRVVINAQKGSSSLLQRKLRIGYNRAARLIDELYEAHVVGPAQGSKPRDVLFSSPDDFYNKQKTSENQEES